MSIIRDVACPVRIKYLSEFLWTHFLRISMLLFRFHVQLIANQTCRFGCWLELVKINEVKNSEAKVVPCRGPYPVYKSAHQSHCSPFIVKPTATHRTEWWVMKEMPWKHTNMWIQKQNSKTGTSSASPLKNRVRDGFTYIPSQCYVLLYCIWNWFVIPDPFQC